jgi:DNA-binding transcriptional LysR family regulator
MDMDRLAAMEAFVRVIEAGSFSGAAKQLRLGQRAFIEQQISGEPE